jgi:hypothetical protein
MMAAATLAAAIFVACGEPYGGNDPTVSDEGGADAGNAPLLDGASADGADPAGDAATRSDASALVDAAGCPTCDCDNDTYNRAGCVDAGVDAGRIDCDDLDPLRFPGQGYVEAVPSLANGGDWNCDTQVDRLFAHDVSCGTFAGAACSSAQGFTTNPGCGISGTYVTCQAGLGGLGCNVATSQSRVQKCK